MAGFYERLDYEWDHIDELETALNKPFYLLKMARAKLNTSPAMRKGAKKVIAQAKRDIHAIVAEYTERNA